MLRQCSQVPSPRPMLRRRMSIGYMFPQRVPRPGHVGAGSASVPPARMRLHMHSQVVLVRQTLVANRAD